jgi:hypothetical protein
MNSVRDWAIGLPAQGRYTFTTAEARAASGASEAAVAAALGRAEADHLIASPVRGFHVVLPLEDRGTGSPSWRLFLDPLMTHLGLPYYVGLLTAASIHGASGQAAQVVQVVTARPRRRVRCGRLVIEFVVRGTAAAAPVELRTTPSGRMRVATPEVVALDLMRYPAKAAGWGNVATVLRDLASSLRRSGLRAALAVEPTAPELQRLGHLLKRVGADDVLPVLEAELASRRVGWVPLIPGETGDSDMAARDQRWHVMVNAEPQVD